MLRFETVAGLKAALRARQRLGLTVGFVPTMGALHAGHLSLVEQAKGRADVVVASVFVNPKQFGEAKDLSSYPRDVEADADRLSGAGCDILFAPTIEEMYPDSFETEVRLPRAAAGLEGEGRPGHFDGVATVVLKLFGIVRPDVAVFGEKDFQQLVLIRRLARDLALDVDVVGAPLVRDRDGLALSSRNARLKPKGRKQARALSRALFAAREAFEGGETAASALVAVARRILEEHAVDAGYLELRDADTLEPLETVDRAAVLLVAATVGGVRLLDNVVLRPPEGGSVRRVPG